MGDRCYCYLATPEPFTPELLALIEEEGPDADNGRTDRMVWFDGVNYAAIPEKIEHHLRSTKTPFAWWNAAGGEYGEGVLLFDGKKEATFMTVECRIVVTVDDLTPSKLGEARRWQNFWNSIG